MFTGHKSLQHVLTQNDLNLRKRRWLKLLEDYVMSVKYHTGKANMVADALSRISIGSVSQLEDYGKREFIGRGNCKISA